MRYDCVLFDLDGTLTNPVVGITNAVIRALEKSGISPPPREELLCFIGPPLLESFMTRFLMSEPQARDAIDYYREYYSVRGLFENVVYPGIPQLLTRLKDCGVVLEVATGKPETYSIEILRHFSRTR